MSGRSSKAWEECARIGPLMRQLADEIWKILGWLTAGNALCYLGVQRNDFWIVLIGLLPIFVGIALLGFSLFSLFAKYGTIKKTRDLDAFFFSIIATVTLLISLGISAFGWSIFYRIFSQISI